MSDQDTALQDHMAGMSRSRLQLLLGIVAAALILGGVTWMFAGGGSDDLEVSGSAATAGDDVDLTGSPAAQPVLDDGDSGDAVIDALPVVTYEVFLSRDPFEPVVPELAATPAVDTTDTGNTADPVDTTDPGDTTDDGDPATDPNTTDDVCAGSQEVVCDGQVVSLIDITTDAQGDRVAVVQIDTTIYEVRKGDVFAERYVLLDVTATTATIAYVDEAFTLMVGDRVLK